MKLVLLLSIVLSSLLCLSCSKTEEEKKLSAFQTQLNSPDSQTKVIAILEMSQDQKGLSVKKTAPLLVSALKDSDVNVRNTATIALVKLGLPSIPLLKSGLQNKSELVRKHCAIALGKIGPEAMSAVLPLISLIQDKDDTVKLAAIQSLGKIGAGTHTSMVLPLLQDNLDPRKEEICYRAAETLYKMGEKGHKILALALEEESRACKKIILNALVRQKRNTLSLFLVSLKDSDYEIKKMAIKAIGNMQPPSVAALPALQKELKDESLKNLYNELKALTLEALAQVGASSKLAPLFVKHLDSESASVRINAIRALGSLGTDASFAVPRLLTMLQDQDAKTRIYAAKTLGDIGLAAREAEPLLVKSLLEDKAGRVRQFSAKALGQIKAQSPEAVDALRKALLDTKSSVVWSAAWSLGEVGLLAKPALTDLEITITRKNNGYIRKNATEAIRKIKEAK